MNARIRLTTTVHDHTDPKQSTGSIPQGVELDAWIDETHVAWTPYQGQTYAVFASEYEVL